ncbi:universal stress protein [Streptomyces gardneri]|uniref:universal stress protein n=1 Tax=Nocardia sputi TaxID=2943705 RepID=UPI001894E04D|nr:universal stress protein [Streptomyces gardneri]
MTSNWAAAERVGVDGSPASLAAIRWGAAMAARREAPLHLVHAIGVPVHALPVIGSFTVRYQRIP